MHARIGWPLAVAAALVFSSAARADAPEFNLIVFHAPSGGDGTATVEGARPLIDGETPFELKLWYFNEASPVVIDPAGTDPWRVVNRRIGAIADLNVHLWSRLSIAAQVPVVFTNNGNLGYISGPQLSQVAPNTGPGDIRLTPRWSILRQEEWPLDLSVQASVDFGTGPAQSLISDRDLGLEVLAAAARRFAFSRPGSGLEVLLNGYYRYRQSVDHFTGNFAYQNGYDELGPQAGGRLALVGYTGATDWYVPHKAYAEFELQLSLRQPSNEHLMPAEWRAGVQWCFAEAISLDVGYGKVMFNDGWGAPEHRVMVGVGYQPTSCSVLSAAEKAKAAALAAEEERARRELEAKKVAEAEAAKKAADEAAKKAAEDKARAEEAAKKAAADAAKKAADEKAKADEAAMKKADRDGDGVPDYLDNCPDVPGPKDNAGCPVAQKQMVTISEGKIELKEQVQFAAAKAVIAKGSFGLLDQIVAILKAHPEVKKVRVEGHTDNAGVAAKNLKLSEERAAAVVSYLTKAGIAKERLEAKGLGDTKPQVANDSKAHREQNRRVELHIVP